MSKDPIILLITAGIEWLLFILGLTIIREFIWVPFLFAIVFGVWGLYDLYRFRKSKI